MPLFLLRLLTLFPPWDFNLIPCVDFCAELHIFLRNLKLLSPDCHTNCVAISPNILSTTWMVFSNISYLPGEIFRGHGSCVGHLQNLEISAFLCAFLIHAVVQVVPRFIHVLISVQSLSVVHFFFLSAIV